MSFWKGALFAIVAIVLAGVLAAACAPSATPTPAPIVVTDDLGRKAEFARVPQRIVSLAPSNTEILYALGLGERIVGVDDYSDYPEEAKAKPKMGAPFPGFNIERIVAQEPEMVLAISGAYLPKLEAAGLRVVVLQPKDIDGVMVNITMLGKATGRDEAATKVIKEMKERMGAVTSKIAKTSLRPRVFFELDATEPAKPWTAGPGSFIDALIAMAGGTNIAAKAPGEWLQLSAEEIINADPEVIFLADAQYGVTVDSVKGRPGWQGIAAVKKGAIYPIDPNLVSRPGPRLVEGLEAIARTLHSEAFK